MPRKLDVRPGVYLDSVTLMQVSRDIGAIDGVRSAMIAMATALNLDLLTGMGFTPPDDASPTDLLVAIDASDDDALARAVAAVESSLTAHTAGRGGSGAGSGGGFGAAPAPRTVRTALDQSGGTLALVSTPGRYAFLDAMDALDAGRPVVVFSDNVPVEQEIRLKEEAVRRDLLVMGPDCGTAVIGGVGLGFANVVRPGPVGIVAASGTGAQQLMCLLDGAGVGISHCIGVGSRDMSSAVGGRTTLAALDLLAGDDATEAIVVIGKPPAAEVAATVRERAAQLGKTVLIALQGPGQPDLTATAESVVTSLGREWSEPRWWPAPTKRTGHYPHIRGLYSGGTLCDEAMLIASDTLGTVRSNIPLRQEWDVGPGLRADGHVMIDFGDDALTVGRPHPMIDGTLRVERIRAEADDPTCGVLLLDVVLGHGAHPDPAAELVPAIAAAQAHAGADGRDLAVVVALVGSAGDPQGLERQATALRDAGASVHLSHAAAARKAVELVAVPQ